MNMCPVTRDRARHDFFICLSKDWTKAVKSAALTQEQVSHAVKVHGRHWLDACGYHQKFDPDNCGFEADQALPPGPNTKPLYGPEHIRLRWGEWGIESLYVPGDACGLYLDHNVLGRVLDGPVLVPHNIDTWSQKQLLLIVFCWFAETVLHLARVA